MNEIKSLIIADDFTGANDTGVQLLKRNQKANVILNVSNSNEIKYDSVVLDTESRNIRKKDAYERVKKLTHSITKKQQFDFIYKKIDSTLRGNILEEIRAIDEILRPDIIIFAPAFPENGRYTIDGIHFLNDKRLLETEIASDPLYPIQDDDITNIFESWSEVQLQHHGLQKKYHFDKKVKIHTFDVENQMDLRNIVLSGLETSKKILWVGSAGLAQALFEEIYPVKNALAVVGSVSEKSFSQIRYAENKGIPVIKLETKDIFNKSEYQKYADKIVQLLKETDVILTAARERSDYDACVGYALEHKNLAKENSSWFVQAALSKISRDVLEKRDVSGLFLTGGDTAIALIDEFEAEGSKIEKEVEIGVVHSTIREGIFENLSIITKAGAFGKEDTLYNCISYLKEGN
ncbi:four-carbon acid sugar kinase family protein [Aerococcus urinaeequi]|uniref:four-carbon acid sugar kinase family protein n=1 Tax=Aerococcus urinaeequi TaxID=51665 RepID=UPI0039BD8674